MSAKIRFTDKDHSLTEREIFASQYVPGAVALQVSDQGYSGFDGFGVAITPSSCYELSLIDPSERKELLQRIYSKDGVGLSVGRICVASSDFSPCPTTGRFSPLKSKDVSGKRPVWSKRLPV